jgi:2-oxoglutarate dehydrogenase E2 component (dihydrolipoamide succinyltransferase)
MPIEVKIPAVGESITSGVVSVWHKKSGEFVSAGDALFTLETDKVSTEIVAEQDGVLETKVPEGQEVKIGEVVATIDESKTPAEEKKAEKPPEKKTAPEEKGKEPEEKKKEPAAEKKSAEEEENERPPQKAKPLSPAVRRIVEEEEIESEKIPGSGKGGRLTKGDVLAAVQERGKADLSAVYY